MAKNKKKSKLDYFKNEIDELMKIGVSIKCAWLIINSKLPEYAKVSYSGFYYYIQENYHDA